MPYDKLVDSTFLDNGLKQIADSIRAKTGTEDELAFPSGMSEAIDGISGGDDTLLDAFLTGSITEVTSYTNTIREYALAYSPNLTSVNLPNITVLSKNALRNSPLLKNVNLPNVVNAQDNALMACTSLEHIELPKLTDLGASVFSSCKALRSAKIGGEVRTMGMYPFSSCSNLELVDYGGSLLGSSMFSSCYSLKHFILRRNSGSLIVNLSSSSVFSGCYHFYGTVNDTYNPDGLLDGYIYVPSSTIETYKKATNWSAFASQFRVLEDYTVDGTITGELDESKF